MCLEDASQFTKNQELSRITADNAFSCFLLFVQWWSQYDVFFQKGSFPLPNSSQTKNKLLPLISFFLCVQQTASL